MARRVQVGGTSFGKIEVKLFLIKLNFTISKIDVGHLQKPLPIKKIASFQSHNLLDY